MGAKGFEGARSCEFYPASEIPKKYVYDAFNDLLIYLVVVVVLLFGTSKAVIM